MKIIFVGDYQTSKILPAPTKVGKELFNHFHKMNSDTYFFSYFQEGNKYSRFEKLFGRKKIDHNISRLGFFPFLINVIKVKPDIIFAVTPAFYYLPILFIKKLLHFKYVYYFHSVNKHLLNNYLKFSIYLKFRFLFIEQISTKFSDLILALSKKENELIKQYYPYVKNIEIVNNGFNSLKIKKKLYYVSSVLNVICIGSLDRKEKSYNIVLNALNINNLPIKLTICSNVVQDTLPLKISKNIELTFKSLCEIDLREEISENDLFILGSSYEPFSIALLEAMSTGIPFITSKNVGLVERFENDLLIKQVVPPDDSNALKQKIMEYLNMNEIERLEIGKEGIKFSEKLIWEIAARDIHIIIKNFYKDCNNI